MLAIRLPEDLEKWLEELAKRTGRTKTYYVREAIVEHLVDLEGSLPRRGAVAGAAFRGRTVPPD